MVNQSKFDVCLIFLLGSSVSGCGTPGPVTYPRLDNLSAGIFLEAQERTVLPEGVELRRVYDKGIGSTKSSEGFRSRLYNDAADYCTIGYGHLIKKAPCDGSEPDEFRGSVTEPYATEVLTADMRKSQIAVMEMVNIDLTDGQYAALCDFAFNVGTSNLRKSALLKVVNGKQLDSVPSQFRRWVMAGGKEIQGLKTRRAKEIEL